MENDMNIELDEVVVQDISDDALEQAADGAQGVALKSACCGENQGFLSY
jgi:hypothetical protein